MFRFFHTFLINSHSFESIIKIWQVGSQKTRGSLVLKKVLNIAEGFVLGNYSNLSTNVYPTLVVLSAIEGDGVVDSILDGSLLGQNVFMTPIQGIVWSLGIREMVFENVNLTVSIH
jgi:hypothetical protein